MNPRDLWRQYPILYHIAWEGSWPSIRENGLLSAKALLRLYEKDEEEIARLTQRRRPHWVEIHSPGRPTAVLRDQKPMTDKGLERALQGTVEPWEWYDIINSMVFFWPTKARLSTMLSASAYRCMRHDVLVVDTRKLARLEERNLRLSRMNSGCTKPYPHKRDPGLFTTLPDYPFECRRKRRGWANALAEVCVLGGVKRISETVVEVKTGSATEIMAAVADY